MFRISQSLFTLLLIHLLVLTNVKAVTFKYDSAQFTLSPAAHFSTANGRFTSVHFEDQDTRFFGFVEDSETSTYLGSNTPETIDYWYYEALGATTIFRVRNDGGNGLSMRLEGSGNNGGFGQALFGFDLGGTYTFNSDSKYTVDIHSAANIVTFLNDESGYSLAVESGGTWYTLSRSLSDTNSANISYDDNWY